MAVGVYTLPICDGCKLPWLPTGWKQDSDPRNPKKPLRCGKCKSSGWDREFAAGVKTEVIPAMEVEVDPTETEMNAKVASVSTRCKHRMKTSLCPICSNSISSKEMAQDA